MSQGLISLEEVVADLSCVMIAHYYYKQGRFGRVFCFHNGEWQRSSMPLSVVTRAIESRLKRLPLEALKLEAVESEPVVKKTRRRPLKLRALECLAQSKKELTRAEWAALCNSTSAALNNYISGWLAKGLIVRGRRKKVARVQCSVETFRTSPQPLGVAA